MFMYRAEMTGGSLTQQSGNVCCGHAFCSDHHHYHHQDVFVYVNQVQHSYTSTSYPALFNQIGEYWSFQKRFQDYTFKRL